MKHSVIFNAAGSIVGTWSPGDYKYEATNNEFDAGLTFGLSDSPGQTILEVEIPDELMELQAEAFIQKLGELESVKEHIQNMVISGQEGDQHDPSQIAATSSGLVVTAGEAPVQNDSLQMSSLANTANSGSTITAGQSF